MLATCLSLAALLASAKPGDTVRMAPGQCPGITLSGLRFEGAPVTIDFGTASFDGGFQLLRSKGLVLRGGSFRSTRGEPAATMQVRFSEAITITGGTHSEATRGVVIARSRDIRVLDSRFHGLAADGIILAHVEGFEVRGNTMREFSPTPTRCTRPDGTVETRVARRVCEARGGTWVDGHHPDCVQMWGPARDGVIVGNRCEGQMQGIFGRADGLLVAENDLALGFPNGVHLIGTGILARDNRLKTLPEARYRVRILLVGERTAACGNILDNPASPNARRPCTAAERAVQRVPA
ncbi:hypothetical protein [Thermaurantiacus sp.]